MDRLTAGQQLNGGGELVSSNGWFRLTMHPMGEIFVYRVQTRASLWHPLSSPQPGSFLAMQTDGNLVVYAPDGTALWASNTGSAGSYVVMQDDGNLVVYDGADTAQWASNTAQDLRSPTIRYPDRGYWFNETSESWKELCRQLPCMTALQWPGYATIVIDDHIAGEDVVIQLWKGWCPKFLGLTSFPGGVGGEVGVYRRIAGKVRPTSLPFLPLPVERWILNAIAPLTDEQLWWPFPELGATLEFSLINPLNDEVFFTAGPETSYWLAKWMEDGSYRTYRTDNPPTPNNWEDYIIEYRINGIPTRRHIPSVASLLLS